MLPLNHKERDLANHKFQGLVEHSHNHLKCSACGADLLDILVTEPDMKYPDGTPVEFSYRADCPFCGDHSYTVKIRGGIGVITPEDRSVNYEAPEHDGETVYLRTSKGVPKNAKA